MKNLEFKMPSSMGVMEMGKVVETLHRLSFTKDVMIERRGSENILCLQVPENTTDSAILVLDVAIGQLIQLTQNP